jgi:hypothetical protein
VAKAVCTHLIRAAEAVPIDRIFPGWVQDTLGVCLRQVCCRDNYSALFKMIVRRR